MTPTIREGFNHVNGVILAGGGFHKIFRGPGGVGKTTSLVIVSRKAEDKGFLSVFIQLKGLAEETPTSYVPLWARNCLRDCLATFSDDSLNPWKHIAASQKYLPGVSCFDLLTFLADADTSADAAQCFWGLHILFQRLYLENVFPVVIFLDQWNAMEKEYWTDGRKDYTKSSHPIGSIFAAWELMCVPVIFKSLSSSCGADIGRGSDGNGSRGQYTAKVWPAHKCRWLLQNISNLQAVEGEAQQSLTDSEGCNC